MARILVIEDDTTLALSLRVALTIAHHDAAVASSLAAARAELAKTPPALIVLDLGLPDGDGLMLLRELRLAQNFVPILALTARSTLEDRVVGLRHGADDYVTKPFDMGELLARIAALLRRQSWTPPAPETQDKARVGRLAVDFRTREARSDDQPVTLSDLELRFLRYLLAHEGSVVTREELLVKVWELAPGNRTRSIDTFVYRLRRLIEPDPARPVHLKSLRGAGYRLCVTPQSGP